MTDHFVKNMRNPNLIEIGKKRPTAIVLLELVVIRAKNTDTGNPDLKPGEAFIGDWQVYCKSERCYREDKRLLEKWQILTFKPTNKGTVAKFKNRAYFDVLWKKEASKVTDKLTDKRRTSDEQLTTNIEIRDKNNTQDVKNFLLPQHAIWEIANKNHCDISEVLNTYQDVINPANREKYKIKDSKQTLNNWVRRGISKGDIKTTSEFASLEILKFEEPKGDKVSQLVQPE